jgi:hypothetical protein
VSEHAHDWKPIEGERGRYGCACGELGWRDRTGAMRVYRGTPGRAARDQLTARPRTVDGGRVAARIAEDWDGGKERDR